MPLTKKEAEVRAERKKNRRDPNVMASGEREAEDRFVAEEDDLIIVKKKEQSKPPVKGEKEA